MTLFQFYDFFSRFNSEFDHVFKDLVPYQVQRTTNQNQGVGSGPVFNTTTRVVLWDWWVFLHYSRTPENRTCRASGSVGNTKKSLFYKNSKGFGTSADGRHPATVTATPSPSQASVLWSSLKTPLGIFWDFIWILVDSSKLYDGILNTKSCGVFKECCVNVESPGQGFQTD